MEPFEHWDDIDLDPGLAKLSMIVAAVGAIYFAYQYWRIRQRRREPPSKSD
jgi:hypothetical protein